MNKQQAFDEINSTQNYYVAKLIDEIKNKNNAILKELTFKSATGTGKTKMMVKLANAMPEMLFIVTTLSRGQLNKQVKTSIDKDSIHHNIKVYGVCDFKINSKLKEEDILSSIDNKKFIWIRDEGHINTNRWEEILADKAYITINFTATPKEQPTIDCNFTNTMMLRTVHQQCGTPEDAISKLIEIKEQHKDISGYNPCAIFRCIDNEKSTINSIAALCKKNKLKYINITDYDDYVMSDLCKDDNEYDVIINKFKIIEGIDIRRAHVIYMDNQPANISTTIQFIGRARRNALLYRDDIDIFSEKNSILLNSTRQCFAYYNVENMKIDSDMSGELCSAFCSSISVQKLRAGCSIELKDGTLANGLYVLEQNGASGNFNVEIDKNTGFNILSPKTNFYEDEKVEYCQEITIKRKRAPHGSYFHFMGYSHLPKDISVSEKDIKNLWKCEPIKIFDRITGSFIESKYYSPFLQKDIALPSEIIDNIKNFCKNNDIFKKYKYEYSFKLTDSQIEDFINIYKKHIRKIRLNADKIKYIVPNFERKATLKYVMASSIEVCVNSSFDKINSVKACCHNINTDHFSSDDICVESIHCTKLSDIRMFDVFKGFCNGTRTLHSADDVNHRVKDIENQIRTSGFIIASDIDISLKLKNLSVSKEYYTVVDESDYFFETKNRFFENIPLDNFINEKSTSINIKIVPWNFMTAFNNSLKGRTCDSIEDLLKMHCFDNLKPVYGIDQKDIDNQKNKNISYFKYTKLFNDRESAIIGTDTMKMVYDSSTDISEWIENCAVTNKITQYSKLNSFICNRYKDELKKIQNDKVLFTNKNNFNFNAKCNSCLGYCVEYYSKYLVFGKDFLKIFLEQAQSEFKHNNTGIDDPAIVVRACILCYQDNAKKAFGNYASKLVKTISVQTLIKQDYADFVHTVVTLGTRTANFIKKSCPDISTKDESNKIFIHDPNLSVKHIAALADYISKDTIIDVKTTNSITIQHIKQVLAYHYLQTKRQDLNISRVIVYDAVSGKDVRIIINDKNLQERHS